VSSPAPLDELIRAIVREEIARLVPAQAPSKALTTEEAAELAGVTAKTVRAWISEGRLPAGRRGARRTVQRADLERLLAGEPPAPSRVDDLARRIG
jgi:excisionase family DNA binding protein